MEPFIGLGLKAADSVIDKHFHKIPDKYVHPATYRPQNLIPKKLKKSNGSRRNSEDVTGNSDNEYDEPLPDIPTHSGAPSSENTRFPPDEIPINSRGSTPQPSGNPYGIPPLYSQQPPKLRPQYVPPPPLGGVYPPSPPPSASATQPPPQDFTQFTRQPPNFNRDQYYDDSISSSRRRKSRRSYQTPPDQSASTYDNSVLDARRSRTSRRSPLMTRRSSSYQAPRKRSYDDVKDGSSDTFRTRRPKAPGRRSSSYQAPRGRSGYDSDSESESDRTEARKSNALVRRERSRSRHERSGVIVHQQDQDSDGVSRRDEKIVMRRSGSRPASGRELRTYNRGRSDDSDSDRTYTHRRSKPSTRRSSSYYPPRTRYQPSPPSSSSSHHKPSSQSCTNTKPRDRRPSLSSPTTNSRSNTGGSKGDLFTSSKAGLTGGAVGALIGGWAAQKAHGNYRDRDKGDGGGHTVMTLLGAAMGGLAVNAVVEKVEERKLKKDGFGNELGRRESGRRKSVAEVRMGGRRRVEDWDDGYGYDGGD